MKPFSVFSVAPRELIPIPTNNTKYRDARKVGADTLGHCSDAIRANPEVVRRVCAQNCNGLRWAHASLQADRCLVRRARGGTCAVLLT